MEINLDIGGHLLKNSSKIKSNLNYKHNCQFFAGKVTKLLMAKAKHDDNDVSKLTEIESLGNDINEGDEENGGENTNTCIKPKSVEKIFETQKRYCD